MESLKIADDLISELYVISEKMNKPITVLVDELLRLALQITKRIDQLLNGGNHETKQGIGHKTQPPIIRRFCHFTSYTLQTAPTSQDTSQDGQRKPLLP